jgi:hypothetical protein
MHHYQWSAEKNAQLKHERDLGFERIVLRIENGDLLDVYDHPNRGRYPGQQILVVRVGAYVYLVPFVESDEGRFLKTIIPSRKATRQFLGENHEQD